MLNSSIARLTTKEANEARIALASRRAVLTKEAIAKENLHAAEIAQKETDDEALRSAYEEIRKFKAS